MTKEEYIKVRSLYLANPSQSNRDACIRAYLDWAGTVLDGLGVKYTTAEKVKNEQAKYDMVRAL